jgi:hypothetical protein
MPRGEGVPMTGEMTIKTSCLNCGKKKAIKNKITFLSKGKVSIYTRKGCYKCGWHPDKGE